jgi:hypothetical protein
MTQKPRRKATIADAMLLIIGAGLSLACWRYIMWMPVWEGVPDSLQRLYFEALGTVAFLTPLSLTLLVIALLPPRRRLRRVVFQPAVIVGLSAFFVLIVNTALLRAIMSLVGSPHATFSSGKVLYFCRLLAEQTGMAVGATWFIQAVGGRCRRPTSWVDIFGWVLAACWIILALASAVFTLV